MDKTLNLIGDFETNPPQQIEDTQEYATSVWATALCTIEAKPKTVHLAQNLQDTIDFFEANSKKQNINVYYHNLKFDGKFIIDFLMKNGFTYSEKLEVAKSFNTLITEEGTFYCITIKFSGAKRGRKVKIMDSLKIIPLPVKAIAKSFGTPMLKGELDYSKYRGETHVLTKEEIAYIENDIHIVGHALHDFFSRGLDKMTIASCAMSSYKEIIGAKTFRYTFPVLDGAVNETQDVDDYIRKSYKGGYTFVNPKFQNKVIEESGVVYDVNSLYPSVMYNNLLPYDNPVFFEGAYEENDNFPLYVQRVKCKFKLKDGFIPIIQLKGNSRFCDTEYLSDSGVERVELTVTSVDWELIKKHYTITRLTFLDGFMFKGKVGLFKDYIDHWTKIKIESEKNGNKGMRQIAKLMLNSLYGRFATSKSGITKTPYLDNGVVKFEVHEGEERETVYTAMASFITAYARRETIEGAMANFDNFIYCDTDSIHLVGDKAEGINIHATELGAWKYEYSFTRGKFLRAKTYFEETVEEGNVIKCAGMPSNCKDGLRLEDFKKGLTVGGKKVPKTIAGGVVLLETTFRIL